MIRKLYTIHATWEYEGVRYEHTFEYNGNDDYWDFYHVQKPDVLIPRFEDDELAGFDINVYDTEVYGCAINPDGLNIVAHPFFGGDEPNLFDEDIKCEFDIIYEGIEITKKVTI